MALSRAELRSRLPEIAAQLPIRAQAVAMEIAASAAIHARERAMAQYDGDFGITSKEVSGSAERAARGVQTATSTGAGVYAHWYWFFGEFGTVRQPARPFMIPALEAAYAEVYPKAREVFARL